MCQNKSAAIAASNFRAEAARKIQQLEVGKQSVYSYFVYDVSDYQSDSVSIDYRSYSLESMDATGGQELSKIPYEHKRKMFRLKIEQNLLK
jgi:hypothetical protein